MHFKSEGKLEDIIKEHPEYTKVYFKTVNADGKIYLSLSKGSGDELYFVSNKEYEDPKLYLRKQAVEAPKKNRHEVSPVEMAKKTKQPNLFNFFKKTDKKS